MKRVLTIGRDYSSDIHINDNTDIVSRNHATIEIGRFGKYYIVDQSRNGTYVNGIRIPSQQKYEVRRGEEVSLAHTAILDWSLVPKDRSFIYVLIGVVSVIVAVTAVVVGVLYFDNHNISNSQASGGISVEDITPMPEQEPEPSADADDEKKEAEVKPAPKKEAKTKPTPKKETKAEPELKEDNSNPVVDAIY